MRNTEFKTLLSPSDQHVHTVPPSQHSPSPLTAHNSSQTEAVVTRVEHCARDPAHLSHPEQVDHFGVELCVERERVEDDVPNTSDTKPEEDRGNGGGIDSHSRVAFTVLYNFTF